MAFAEVLPANFTKPGSSKGRQAVPIKPSPLANPLHPIERDVIARTGVKLRRPRRFVRRESPARSLSSPYSPNTLCCLSPGMCGNMRRRKPGGYSTALQTCGGIGPRYGIRRDQSPVIETLCNWPCSQSHIVSERKALGMSFSVLQLQVVCADSFYAVLEGRSEGWSEATEVCR
jgi:hypothetical protein